MLLVDGFPQAQLRSDAVIEPLQNGQAVAALGRSSQPEHLDRPKMAKEPRI